MSDASQNEAFHIVVSTDLSPASDQAYRYAVAVALGLGGPEHVRITLLTIEEASFDLGVGRLVASYFESVTAARAKALEAAVATFAKWGIKATPEHRGGTPFRTIAAFAIEEDVDLIVLARHRRTSPLPRRILGSTVKRLLPVATVPVLVVPVDDTVGATNATELPSFKNALAATDLSEEAGEALGRTARLMARMGGDVTALHVIEPPIWAQVVAGATLPPLPISVVQQTKDDALAALGRQVERYGTQGVNNLVPSVVEGFSAESICAAADQTGAACVTVAGTGKGAAERIMLGSTAERVVRTARVPVLVWPCRSRDPRIGR